MNFKLKDKTYSVRELEKYGKTIPKSSKELLITIGMGQRLSIENHVITHFELTEDCLEGIYILRFQCRKVTKEDNIQSDFLHYEVQKNAEGTAILVQVS